MVIVWAIKMRVLVTGASGYIGSVLVPFLEQAGYEVQGLDLGLYSESPFSDGVPVPDQRDIRDLTVGDFDGFDAVISLAALSNEPLGNLDPEITYQINHRANVDTGRLAKLAGVERFLFASSCSLYGAAGAKLVDESAPFASVTPYGRSKALVEDDLRSMADDVFSPTYLRNATVYGVSPALRLDCVVNNLTAWAVATGRIALISDGTPWRPQIHVEDVANAFAAVLRAPRETVHNEAFNVGRNDENYQVREIAELVRDEVPNTELEMAAITDYDTRSYRVDFSKLPDVVPGSEPTRDISEGIRDLVKAFEEADLTEAGFDRYTRLAEISRLIELGDLSRELRWL